MTDQIDQPVILLVEDEELIAALVEEELRESGFAVIHAADGVKAQMALMSCPTCDGVVMDINLPGSISGWELARAAREQRPQIAVVYATGHGEVDWPSEGVPGSVLLTKPYMPREVTAALREQIALSRVPKHESNAEPGLT